MTKPINHHSDCNNCRRECKPFKQPLYCPRWLKPKAGFALIECISRLTIFMHASPQQLALRARVASYKY